jgi:hypothetical protein
MKYNPEEILFSPSSACNLKCAHCGVKKRSKTLSSRAASAFLRKAKSAGVKKAGFTGGEPFLNPSFLCAVIRQAAKLNMGFTRIMTNGVWHKNARHLKKVLRNLFDAGYDGEICVSADVFHRQGINKLAEFIKASHDELKRNDAVSIAYVSGVSGKKTKAKIQNLARTLNLSLRNFGKQNACLAGNGLYVRLYKIELSPVGRAVGIKNPWDGKWFREDFCQGPGNVFNVLPDGCVSVCCGYANEEKQLIIGNIYGDTPGTLLENARSNRFVRDIYTVGLSGIRKRLLKKGVKFPGKTSNNCFFCWHILTRGLV